MPATTTQPTAPEFTDAAVQAAIATLGARYGSRTLPTVQQYRTGSLRRSSPVPLPTRGRHLPACWTWRALIDVELRTTGGAA